MHSSVVPREPRELLEEPIYHLDLLLHDQSAREAKAREYESLRPGLSAAGGGPQNLYYLPEEWAVRPAGADASRTRRLASAPCWTPTRSAADRERPTGRAPASGGRRDDRRPVGRPGDCGGETMPRRLRHWTPDTRFAPGEHGSVTVRVTNDGATCGRVASTAIPRSGWAIAGWSGWPAAERRDATKRTPQQRAARRVGRRAPRSRRAAAVGRLCPRGRPGARARPVVRPPRPGPRESPAQVAEGLTAPDQVVRAFPRAERPATPRRGPTVRRTARAAGVPYGSLAAVTGGVARRLERERRGPRRPS